MSSRLQVQFSDTFHGPKARKSVSDSRQGLLFLTLSLRLTLIPSTVLSNENLRFFPDGYSD
jgi:hypothetical protein